MQGNLTPARRSEIEAMMRNHGAYLVWTNPVTGRNEPVRDIIHELLSVVDRKDLVIAKTSDDLEAAELRIVQHKRWASHIPDSIVDLADNMMEEERERAAMR